MDHFALFFQRADFFVNWVPLVDRQTPANACSSRIELRKRNRVVA
jgi:hypothetical protein